jgi:hypothetical protein
MHRFSVVFAALAILAGCATAEPTYHTVDPDRILTMAGQEAGQITSPLERLSTRLNIANRQSNSGRNADARATLAAARQTLESAGKFDLTDHQRLAGWISISELNRAADDRAAAGAALDNAIQYLNNLQPAYTRCQYVIGVADEINALRGQSASAELIKTAGDWAVQIPDEITRRRALATFASALFRCNDYGAAQKMLHYDPDVGWRSIQLVRISDIARRNGPSDSSLGFFFGDGATAEAAHAQSQSFGEKLDFRTNFYRGL